MLENMSYPGGKGNSFQQFINYQPPHTRYYELFLGHGRVMLNKKPAGFNTGMDADPAVAKRWEPIEREKRKTGNYLLGQGDAFRFLERHEFYNTDLIYLDPPYLPETRSRKKLYNFELTRKDHERLLELIRHCPAMIQISGYKSTLYTKALKSWNHFSFWAMTRGHTLREEFCWFNYPEPVELHDYRFLGVDFTDRQRIKRKKQTWVSRLEAMPRLERLAVMAAIDEMRFQTKATMLESVDHSSGRLCDRSRT
jgi:hypothetical protein